MKIVRMDGGFYMAQRLMSADDRRLVEIGSVVVGFNGHSARRLVRSWLYGGLGAYASM